MLYIFAGFPGRNTPIGGQTLHAGGLRHCIETVENLAILESDPMIQYRKEGVFIPDADEGLYLIEYRMSDMCLRDGITWDYGLMSTAASGTE